MSIRTMRKGEVTPAAGCYRRKPYRSSKGRLAASREEKGKLLGIVRVPKEVTLWKGHH